MRDGHAQAQRDGVDGRAAGPHQVRAHQRLAVTGRQGMPRAEGHRREQRAEQHERREVPGLEQAGDVAAHAAGHGAGRGRDGLRGEHGSRRGGARRRGSRRPSRGRGVERRRTRQRHRVRDAERCQGRPAWAHRERYGAHVERLGQQVLRVGREAVRDRGRRQRTCRDGHPAPGDHHLPPAQSLLVGTVAELDRAPSRQRSRKRRAIGAAQTHRLEAGRSGWEAQPRGDRDEGQAPSGDRQAERRGEHRAGGDPLRLGLGVGHRAVRVRVDPELLLEGRDLGLVDHDVEDHPVRLDPDPGEVVDREIAQRMGQRQRGHDEGEPDARDDGAESSATWLSLGDGRHGSGHRRHAIAPTPDQPSRMT